MSIYLRPWIHLPSHLPPHTSCIKDQNINKNVWKSLKDIVPVLVHVLPRRGLKKYWRKRTLIEKWANSTHGLQKSHIWPANIWKHANQMYPFSFELIGDRQKLGISKITSFRFAIGRKRTRSLHCWCRSCCSPRLWRPNPTSRHHTWKRYVCVSAGSQSLSRLTLASPRP